MPMDIEQTAKELRGRIAGEVQTNSFTRELYSRDASIFEIQPSIVVFPKVVKDVEEIVRFVHEKKSAGQDISLSARAAGTDMTGGSLTSSIMVVFTKYLNQVQVFEDYAVTQLGAYYRDFEKETLKHDLILPSYPVSRNIAAMGGIINNNSGGERTLMYGQTDRYVEELHVVLSDGSTALFHPLDAAQLEEKKKLQNLEGEIYRRMHELIQSNEEVITAGKPTVSKNASGYALWRVWNKEKNTFNLAQLIVGAQGTLAFVTAARVRLVHPKNNRAMLVIFLKSLSEVPAIVHRVLAFEPESFESYDDHTFKLAIRFLPDIMRGLGLRKMIQLGFAFLPEVWMALTGGVPKLILTAEFAEDSAAAAQGKADAASQALESLGISNKVAKNEIQSEKYWIVRRESFSLLRKNLHGYTAAPFIDDFVVNPDLLPRFMPELNELLAKYDLIYTVAGHIGNGNFHIIPLMNMSDPKSKEVIRELSGKVYELIIKYHGSITGEHNDGIIRTPFLPLMFGERMVELFAETKKIFDPLNILNPGKKVGGTFENIATHMISKSQV